MNSKELFFANGKTSGVFSCGKCGLVYRDRTLSARCCKPYVCRYCGKEVEDKHLMAHKECADKDQIAKAEKLESWDGWVYLDGYGYKEGYFESLEDLLEYLDDDGTHPRPEWAFVCKTIPFKGPDIGNIIENCCEDMYEDAEDSLSGLDKLELAIKEFNEANKGMVSYYPDHKRAVRIPAREVVNEN